MNVQIPEVGNATVREAIDSMGEIATLPEVTVRIIEVVEDPHATSRELHDVIKHDPALSAKVLKVVNSAFYGLPGQVAGVERAVILLGRSAVKNIAVAASLARMFSGRRDPDLFDVSDLWKHCLAVAVAGKKLAQAAGSSTPADEMFLAGLIHDLGLIVARQTHASELAEVCRKCSDGEGGFLQLEQDIIGATHQDFGYALTTKWRFPEQLRACVSGHHNPETLDDGFQPMAWILRCADILCCRDGLGFDLQAKGDEITDKLLEAVGLTADDLARTLDGLEGEVEEAEAVLGTAR
ncbi:MAG: HDOD domain-containing protein [Phycisphaerae bacterium]